MINLLPVYAKKEIRAARQNVILRRYCLLLVFAAVLFGGIFVAGFWITDSEKAQAEKAKADSQQSMAQYADVRQMAESFYKDLDAAKSILGSGVSFSQLLIGIASTVPKGVVLSNLALGSSDPDNPVDITGKAKSYQAVLSLKSSLEQSDIFEDVNITSVTQATEQTGNYPFDLTLKAKFSSNEGSK